MRKLYATFFLAILIFYTSRLFSCTSFVIYSTKTYYGMNFDWPETEMRFCIENSFSTKYFHFQFYKNNYFSTTVGMNENGVFCPIQMLYPESTSEQTSGMTLWYAFLYVMQNVDNLIKFTDFLNQTGTQIMPVPGTTLHNLFADTSGNAFVLEVGEDSNLITNVENGILVMTNFPNHQFAGLDYTCVYGAGADRYKAAYAYLLDHRTDFTIADGFEALRRSIQPRSSGYPTMCSMVFDPEEKEIYIALRQNFDRIWKLSLDNQSIQTYAGFTDFRSVDISPEGVLDADFPGMTTGLKRSDTQPEYFRFYPNFPNPFNPATTIYFTLPKSRHVSLKIFNITGKQIATLVDEVRSAGEYHVRWCPKGMPSGIYFGRLQAGSQTKTIKLILQK